jgi:hypothetical protein
MNAPHSQSWRDLQDADRLSEIAGRIYSDELKPACDRSALRTAWIEAARRMGPRLILNRDKKGEPTRQSVPWRALPTEQEAA